MMSLGLLLCDDDLSEGYEREVRHIMRVGMILLSLFIGFSAAGCSSKKDGPFVIERCPGGGTKCVIRGHVPL